MIKHLFTFCAAALFLLLTSCSKEHFITPQSTIVDGDLDKAFELVQSEYPVVVGEDGTATVTLTVKRTAVSVPFVAQHTGIIGTTRTQNDFALAGFGYTLYDAEGAEMEKVEADKNFASAKQQEALLALNTDETGELTIKFDFDEKKVPAKIALHTKLALYSTGDILLDGAIDKYGVKNFNITFNFADKEAAGKYQYKTSSAGSYLYLNGHTEKEDADKGVYTWPVTLVEDNGMGTISGNFDGKLTLTRDSDTDPYYYTLTGEFINFNYKEFKYKLKSAPLPQLYK